MQTRLRLRAVVLSILLVASVVAGIPIGTGSVAAQDSDVQNFDSTGETIDTGAGEPWQQGFAVHNGEFHIAGAANNEIRTYDESFSNLEIHAIDHQPSGLARFDGQWVVATAETGGLAIYDDSFGIILI
ncbi:hypothetical protein [Halomontanus rarus]|uniref:hypothetical protein n=1 Tax=Halomontanus rarus TaxID=3034020 RepID=UPI00307CAF50